MGGSLFTKANLYLFLIEFAFSLLFLVIFCCVHYGLTRTTKLGQRIIKSKMWSFWYFFSFGFILALVTFVVSQVSAIAIGEIGMPLTILGLIYAMTIFYNRSVQIGAILPTIFWILYQYNGFTSFSLDCGMRLIIVIAMAAIAVGTTYIKWKVWPKFLISCLTTTVILLILILSMFNAESAFNCVITLISIASTIFYFAVIKYLNNVLTHMSHLARQGAYVDRHYLIPTVLNEYFNKYLQQHNTSQALIVSLLFNVSDQRKQDVLDQIYEIFKDTKAMFFRSSYQTYGLVLCGEEFYIKDLNASFKGNKYKVRKVSDPLSNVQALLQELHRVPIRAYVSVYGVHSCSLDDLLKTNHYIIKHDDPKGYKNIIQLFNSNMMNQEIQDNVSYATLSRKIDLNDIDVELETIQMNKDNKIYVCPRFYWPKMLTCNTKEIMAKFEPTVANTLLRSLAVKSMEKYASSKELHDYELLIYYPLDQLNSNTWSPTEFIKKIQMYGINPEMIVLSFNTNKYQQWPNQIILNLLQLQSHGLKYFLVDLLNISILNFVSPKAIILDKSIYKNKKVLRFVRNKKIEIL